MGDQEKQLTKEEQLQSLNEFLKKELEAFKTEVRIIKKDLVFWKRLALTQLGVDKEDIENLMRDRGLEIGVDNRPGGMGGDGIRRY